jgi:hypothetical protein
MGAAGEYLTANAKYSPAGTAPARGSRAGALSFRLPAAG